MNREEEIRQEITAFLNDDTKDPPNFTTGDIIYLLEKIEDVRAILMRAQQAWENMALTQKEPQL